MCKQKLRFNGVTVHVIQAKEKLYFTIHYKIPFIEKTMNIMLYIR